MVSIIEQLVRNFSKLPDPREFTSSQKLYASEASIVIDGKVYGGCLRNQWYRYLGFKNRGEVNVNYALKSMFGDAFHDTMVTLLDRLSHDSDLRLLFKELPLYDPIINLSGRVDGMLLHKPTDTWFGLEIKSVGDYKVKQSYEAPIIDHVLQALYYLNFFSKTKRKLGGWFILYMARAENYITKGAKHGSPLNEVWEYLIQEVDEGIKITTPNGILHWPHISAQKIISRYNELNLYIANKQLPPRDFKGKLSEEEIVTQFKAEELPYKYQKEAVAKWLKAGAPPGELDLTIEDSQCRFCEFRNLCDQDIATQPEEATANEQKKSTPAESNSFEYL